MRSLLTFASLAVVSLVVAGCAGESAADGAAADPWSGLRRSLQIPRISPGMPCPVTPARVLSRAFAPGQGRGPAYPVGAAGGLEFIYPVRPSQGWYPSEWGGNKVAWVAPRDFKGRILVRGRQVDGRHGLRFGDEPRPVMELHLTLDASDLGEGGWLQFGTFTRVRAAGCYAWQVDGRKFSRVIVFRAIRVP
jgi:hypothetical protein